MRTWGLLAFSTLACALVFAGCNSGDLGECNLDGTTPAGDPIEGPAAFDVAYRQTDGVPMFEGQAIVQSSCGNGSFCHTPNAGGGDRFGTPAGLNFDVDLACNEAIDPDCPTESLQLLQSSQNYTASWGEGIISEVRGGTMPPGAAGRQVRDDTPWIREEGTPLPVLGTSEATEIVRNWLACGAPVVARTDLAPSEAEQLQDCPSIEGEVCKYLGPTAPLPDPTWSSIYWNVMFTQCVTCHGPANSNIDQNPNNPNEDGRIPGGASAFGLQVLDLTGSDPTDTSNWAAESHSALVGASASPNGLCAAQGINVIAGDSANSLMIEKMRAIQTCGGEMPLGGGGQTIPDPVIEVIEQWIDGGAPND